jgi:hypothetical protein
VDACVYVRFVQSSRKGEGEVVVVVVAWGKEWERERALGVCTGSPSLLVFHNRFDTVWNT